MQSSPASAYDYRNGSDIDSDNAYAARREQQWIGQSDAIMARRAADVAERDTIGDVAPRPGMVLTSEGWRDRRELSGYGAGYGANARLADASGNYFGIAPSDERGFFPDRDVEPGPRRSTDPVAGSNRDQVKQAVYRSFAEDVAARKAEQPSFASPGMSGMDKAHLLLDGVNLVADGPFAMIGAGAGLIDAGLYLYEGKKLDAAMSLAGTVPLIGAELSAARLGSRATRLGEFEATEAVLVTGRRPAGDVGHSYQRAIQDAFYGGTKEKPFEVFLDGAWQSRRADSVTMVAGRETAVEAKYVDDWAKSLRNPANTEPWALAEQTKMLDQARGYSSHFDGGAVYHTNSVELATHWSKVFAENSLQNIRFIMTPAVKH
jgi:hypothetical protein